MTAFGLPHTYPPQPEDNKQLMTSLKDCIYLPSFGYSRGDGIDPVDRLRQWCIRAEALGFDFIWVTDHPLRVRDMRAYKWIEPLTTPTFAVAVTSKIVLGIGALLLALRCWVLLAKTLSSLQQLPNDRFTLGAGSGRFRPEVKALGLLLKHRGARPDEVPDITHNLMTGQTITYEGKFYDPNHLQIEPSLAPMLLWVGGGRRVTGEQLVQKPDLPPNGKRRHLEMQGGFSRLSPHPKQVANDLNLVHKALLGAAREPDEMVPGLRLGQWLHLTEDDPKAAQRIQHWFAAKALSDGRDEEHLDRSCMFSALHEVLAQCRAQVDVWVKHLNIYSYPDDLAQLELWGRGPLPRLKSMTVSRPRV